MKISLNFQDRVAVMLAVLIIAVSGMISVVIGWHSSAYIKEEIGNSLAETAYMMAENMDRYMWARSGEITVLSKLSAMNDPDNGAEISRLLDDLKTNIPAFSWIGRTDGQGRVLASTGGILKGVDISQRPVYKEGIQGTFIGDVHDAVLLSKLLPNPSGEPMKFVDVSVPVRDAGGMAQGVLAAHLSWEWVDELQQFALEPLQDKKSSEVFVISADNTILLGPKPMIGTVLNLESLAMARQGKSGWRIETWPDQGNYLTGYAFGDGYKKYAGLGWTVLIRQPEELAFVPVKELQLYIWVTGAAFALLFAVIGRAAANSVAKPLRVIARAADQLRFGEKFVLPPYRGTREIEILSDAINQLVESLTSTESELGQMSVIAHHDKLTGLRNRLGVDDFVKHAQREATRTQKALVVFYADLDGFKAVNDTLGHDAGDELLRQIAGRLKDGIRDNELAARLGGDEFLLIVYAKQEKLSPVIEAVGRKIIASINEEFDIQGHRVHVGCSLGAAVWLSDESGSVGEVIKRADEALYQAKQQGKNRLVRAAGDVPKE